MLNLVSRLIIVFMFVGWSGTASAILIVDTGTREVIQPFENWTLDSLQYSAGIFTVDNSYTISSIEGWIGASNLGTATAAIYTNGGGIPGVELFSAAFTSTGPNAWQGVNGIEIDLEAG